MKTSLTFGSLFAGIGGFDLGFERAGMTCSWQVEIDDYCRKVLAKHWPNVRRWDDVRTFPPKPVDDWRVDVLCGGFPCQDISNAGKRAGIDGERSGLWSEFARIIRVLRPRFVVVENVAALLGRGIGTVLADLAKSGFDAEWGVLPACAMGSPHSRERVFCVAYPTGERFDARREGPQGSERIATDGRAYWRSTERGVVRVAYGTPGRVDRVQACGNAVVPQVAEWIGRRIVASV